MASKNTPPDNNRLDQIVAEARRNRERREQTYREQALRLYPWICTRCGREFTRANLNLLTVHHKDDNHDHNPPDGSNWELLCVYCHENEHRRYLDELARGRVARGHVTGEAGSLRGARLAAPSRTPAFGDTESGAASGGEQDSRATHKPFADLKALLKGKS